MFAGDLAEAILKAASNMQSLPDLMNCGVGYDFSINDYYQTVAKVIGWSNTAELGGVDSEWKNCLNAEYLRGIRW